MFLKSGNIPCGMYLRGFFSTHFREFKECETKVLAKVSRSIYTCSDMQDLLYCITILSCMKWLFIKCNVCNSTFRCLFKFLNVSEQQRLKV